MFKRLLKQDWEVVAVLLAAIIALILHFLHITEEGVLLAIAIVLLAFLLIIIVPAKHRHIRIFPL